MSKRSVLVIVNPCAGMRMGMRYLADILKVLCDHDDVPTVRITKERGEATQIATALLPNSYDMIVCVGGDGTFNEVVAGVMASGAAIPIGYIPTGSTNDFARSLGLSTSPLQAAKDIVSDKAVLRQFDVGSFDGRIFTYVASFGAFTKTSYTTAQSVKNTLGHLAYILEGMKDIPSLDKVHLTLQTDDQVFEGDYLFGAICNSTSLGGLLKLDQGMVDMNDGKLELLLIRAPTSAIDVVQILHCLNTKKYNSEWISFCSTKRIRILSEEALNWTLDGEYHKGGKTVDIVNLHDVIRLCVLS